MKIDLAVIGQGAVTPATVATSVAPVGRPDELHPALRVNLEDDALVRWQREPRLRRVSPITYFLVEAGAQAMRDLSLEQRQRTGLVVAFCAGCLAYSRRFFEAIVTQGQKAASPILFPETVFNSPVSHVAAVLGLEGAAYALVGDETAWIGALKTASIWLQQNRVDQVLVLGAEEFDPIVLDAYLAARWMKRGNTTSGFIPGEGAAGVLVRRATDADAIVITLARDGFIYRSAKEAALAAERCLRECDPLLPCYVTAQRNGFAPIERRLLRKRAAWTKEAPYLGEAFTASAAWNTLRALSALDERQPRLLLPIWGLNHEVGALELTNRSL